MIKWLAKHDRFFWIASTVVDVVLLCLMLMTLANARWYFYARLLALAMVLETSLCAFCRREQAKARGEAKVWWKDWDFMFTAVLLILALIVIVWSVVFYFMGK